MPLLSLKSGVGLERRTERVFCDWSMDRRSNERTVREAGVLLAKSHTNDPIGCGAGAQPRTPITSEKLNRIDIGSGVRMRQECMRLLKPSGSSQ